MHFILSTLKWIDNLLSTNHLQSVDNFHLEHLQLCGRLRLCLEPLSDNDWGRSLIYMKNKIRPKTEHWRTPQINIPASQKTSFTKSKNFLFDREDSNHFINGVLKPRPSHISKSFQYAFPYPCLIKQNFLVVPDTNL